MGTIHLTGQAKPAGSILSEWLSAGQTACGFPARDFRNDPLFQFTKVSFARKLMLGNGQAFC
jgi:hypothetical protein